MLPQPLFLNVHMYGIMIAVGVLFCFGVLYGYAKRLKLNEKLADFVFYDGVLSILVGFGAAALFQAVYNYIEHPEKGFHLDGGITFIGGLIGGAGCFLLVYLFFRRRLPDRLWAILPVIPCCITVAHGFGRVGCFFAGCCYGKESDCIFAVKFPGMSHAVHPTQLYEAVFLFLLFALLSYLLLRHRFAYTMSVYLVAYGVFRFLIEFLRGDDRGTFIGTLSPSQFWSLLMVVAGVLVYFWQKHAEKNTPASQNPAAA